jgi:hypothetical protein
MQPCKEATTKAGETAALLVTLRHYIDYFLLPSDTSLLRIVVDTCEEVRQYQ